MLVASTNGPSHLHELDEISKEVFGPRSMPRDMEAFGTHTGEPILARHFGNVEWRGYDGDLVCTNADDVLAYLVSLPPGERVDDGPRPSNNSTTCSPTGSQRTTASCASTKETGAFLCAGCRDRQPPSGASRST